MNRFASLHLPRAYPPTSKSVAPRVSGGELGLNQAAIASPTISRVRVGSTLTPGPIVDVIVIVRR